MAKQLNVNLAFTANTQQAKAQLESLKSSLLSLSNLSGNITAGKTINDDLMTASRTASQLKIALEKATDIKTGKLNLTSFNKSLKDSNLTLGEVRVQLNKLGSQGNQAFLGLANAIQSADAPLVNIGSRLKTMMTTLANTARWQAASSAVHLLVGEMQSAYSYAQSLDKSLNDIRIVSGASADEMAAFAKEANKSAQALSSTTKKYADAALIFYQQGLSDEAVKERTNATIKMANVTGEATDQVSSYMTAVWNNFNKNGTQSVEHFGDVMTKLGADTAASTEEIAGGLEKFASVANTIGLSFEYATSAITTIVDRTRQSEDVVGTALKTIFSRIQGLQQGETLDDGTTLNKYSQGLAAVGIQIKDATGNLKDMDDILDNIGSTWSTLSREQKVALAQTVAGVRQYSQFMALFDNWDFMKENLNTAYSADGTLNEQAEIYAESWEAARKRVRAAAEGIFNSLIDKDFFIDIDDAMTSTLKGLNKFIDSIGGVKGVLLLLGTIGTKVFQTQIASSIKSATVSLNDLYSTAYNKFIKLTGSDAPKRKTSAEITRTEAAQEVENQAESLKKSGNYLDAKIYKEIGSLQQSLLNNAGSMSEVERQLAATLIDRQQAQGKLVIQTQEELQAQTELLNKTSEIYNKKVKQTLENDKEYKQIQEKIKKYTELASLINESKLAEMSNDQSDEGKKRQSNARRAVTNQLKNGYGYTNDEIEEFRDRNHSTASYVEILTNLREDIATDQTNLRKKYEKQSDITRVVDRQIEQLPEYGEELETAIKTTDKFGKSNKNAANYLEQSRAKIAGFSENIVSLTSGLSSAALGFTSLSNAFEELSSMVEEGRFTFSGLSSILLSLTMGLPALTNGLGTLGKAYLGLASNMRWSNTEAQKELATKVAGLGKRKSEQILASKELLMSELKLSAQEAEIVFQRRKNGESLKEALIGAGILKQKKEETAARVANAGATKAEGKALGLLNLGKIKESIGGIGTAVKNLLKTFGRLGGITLAITAVIILITVLIKKWNEDANALKKAQEAAKQAKEQFDSAKSAYDSLKSSIEDYNDALDAIKKLTKGTTEWKEAIQEANQKVIELLESYPELAKYITKSQDGLLQVSEAGQEAILAAQNAKVQNTYRNYARKQINLAEAENKNTITQFARSTGGVAADNTDEKKVINGLYAAYQQEGESALARTAQDIANQYGVSTKTVSDLVNNGLNSLIISLDANTAANDLLNEQIASSTLSQHLEGFDESSYQTVLSNYLDKISNEQEGKKYVNNLSRDDIADAYAALIGIDPSQITSRAVGKMKITDNEGNETKISLQDMKDSLYGEASQMLALPDVESFAEEINILDEQVQKIFDPKNYDEDTSKKLTQGLVNALGQNTKTALADFVSSLTFEEYTAVENALKDGSLQESLDVLYANNKDYFSDLGYKSAEDFITAFNSVAYDQEEAARQAEIKKKENWQGAVDNIAASLEVDSNAVEGYAETLQDLYPQLEGNTDATMAMAEANIKFSKGFDSLVSAIDDNEEALKDLNSTSWLTQEALAEVGNAYEEMTGVNVSNDFIKEHLNEIKKLADGDISVLEELGEAAARDFVAHLEIPDEDINAFQNVLDNLKAKGEGVEIGIPVDIDNTRYLATLNQMLADGELTAEQVRTAFNSMGYEPNIDYIEGKQTNNSHIGIENGTGLFAFLNDSGFDAVVETKMDVPVIQPKGHTKISTPKSLGSSIHPSQTTSGKKKKDGGGDKKEMDRYHTITRQIKTLQTQYDRLATARDRAWGKNSIKYIDAEIKKTDQLIKKQKTYLKQIKTNLLNDRAKLKQYGTKYDEDGVITNYRSMFKKYGQSDLFEERLKKYEETLELWQEQQTKLQEELNQRQDLRYEKITTKVEYKIELEEGEKKTVETFFNLLSDNVYKSAEALELLNKQFDYNINIGNVYRKEHDELQKAWAKGRISQADYKEGLTDVRDGLLEQIEALNDLDQEMLHYYGDTLEKAKSELDEYVDMLDAAADKLEHFRKVQELSGNGVDYKNTLELIKAQKQVAQNSYDVAKQWYESRKASQKEIETRLATMDKNTNPAAYELEEQKWKDAVKATNEAYSTMADYRETYLELAKEEYETVIDQIYDYADKKLSKNMGFNSLLDSMSNLKTYADEYLTKTNQLYETNKMMRTLEQDVAKTSNTAAKQKLNNFAKEIESAQKQNKLSNLELEILQAKYKQLQAQIALEEAQNAKDKVRLSRDSEGNYGYVYTANEDAISKAQQDLDDADNDLYNIRLKAFNSYGEKVEQAKKELLEKLKQIDQDETLSTEEKEKEKARITKEYGDIIQAYGDLANIAQQEDARIQQDAWAAAYTKEILDATNWKETVDQLLKESKDAHDSYHKNIDDMVRETKEGHEDWGIAIDDVKNKNEELKKKILDEVIPALDDEIDKVDKTTEAYKDQRDSILNLINTYKNLVSEINNAITALSRYQEKASKTNTKSPSGTGSGGSNGNSGNGGKVNTNSSGGKTSSTNSAIKETYSWKIISGSGSVAKEKSGYKNKSKAQQDAEEYQRNNYSVKHNYMMTHAGWSGSCYVINVKIIGLNSKQSHGFKVSTSWAGVIRANSMNELETNVKRSFRAYYPKKKTSNVNAAWDNVKDKVVPYDTGGYTGEWGNSGKLAMLHQKELVLNAEDTKNFLAGIEVLRDVVQRIDLQAMYAGSTNIAAASVGSSKSTLAQEVSIHAEFPNAVNHNEIEQAFDTLINRAAQYANRK